MSTETMQQTPLGATFLVKFCVSTHYMHVHCKNKLVGFNHRVWVYIVYLVLETVYTIGNHRGSCSDHLTTLIVTSNI